MTKMDGAGRHTVYYEEALEISDVNETPDIAYG